MLLYLKHISGFSLHSEYSLTSSTASDLLHELALVTSPASSLLHSQSPTFLWFLEWTEFFSTSRSFPLAWNSLLPPLHLADSSFRSQLKYHHPRKAFQGHSLWEGPAPACSVVLSALMVSLIAPRIICHCTLFIYLLSTGLLVY